MHESVDRSRQNRSLSRFPAFAVHCLCWGIAVPLLVAGCPRGDTSVPDDLSNTTDPTNGGAEYLGHPTCHACHPQIGEIHDRHGHSQILQRTQGTPPVYPVALPDAGVPDPPPGLTWADIDFVIGGYRKGANFIDRNGFLLIDTATGDPLQYNLRHQPTGGEAGFVPSGGIGHASYTFDCFRCHSTGSQSFADSGMREDNRPGVDGHWSEEGVQCEACHGPGSHHVPNPSAGNIYINTTGSTCVRCHSSGTGQILARDGYLAGYQQADEVAASPHAGFNCTICHAPHASVFADRDTAIRNDCTACHQINMALHQGKTFVLGDYSEALRCESCHMSFAARYAQAATVDFTNGLGRVGDTRTHLMYINTEEQDFTSMFTADGTSLVLDANGKGTVTTDFVCLRCHNGLGSAFELDLRAASSISAAIHTIR